MTLIFQIIAVASVGVAAFVLIRGKGQGHQALRRLLMLGFVAAAASSVFFPQIWTWAAGLLGVGRGTDLLLYFLVLVFIGFVASTYRRFRQVEAEITELSRHLALMTAEKPIKGASTS